MFDALTKSTGINIDELIADEINSLKKTLGEDVTEDVAMSLFHHNEQTVKTSNATLPIEVNAPYVRVKASSSNARIEFQNEYQQTINKEFY